ncbi:VOC family protein [uncultured Jatrophihabitans sp.]|uniref:VOC family protein n=1 Tax=uncultured Jatrophihabitans sp. TaxID=1610747 RepID=UPI0035CCA2D0
MTETARLRQVVLDCTDVRALAEFYRELLAWGYRPGDETPTDGEDWLVLDNPAGGVAVAFQLVDALPDVTWPKGNVPQQEHLDLTVSSAEALTSEHERVIRLGARLLRDCSDDPDEQLYVYADPAGHPFCIFVSTRD